MKQPPPPPPLFVGGGVITWATLVIVVGLYVFGFGHLKGDIGLIESDRNPFLHSQHVRRAP